MLTMRRLVQNLRHRVTDERGFTLVELLATMVAGVVVLLALGTIMDVTLRETTRSFTLVDATNRTRPVFEQIENNLHSACFADEEYPLQAGSNANALIFMSSYGNGATPSEVWHEIDYNPPPVSTLTDTTYSTSYSVVNGIPTWSRGTQQGSTKTLLTNVAQTGTTPVFQYYAYQTAPGTDAAGNQYEILPDGTAPVPGTSTTVTNPLDPGGSLTSTDASSAAEVMITLTVGPGGHAYENTNLANVGQSVTDSITFRFTPAANHEGDGASFAPCD
jgi:prepilin-type N-terminal cleavage/methylation domain-containing protein